MSVECIILDFDGTFTLVDEEAAPFLSGFKSDLGRIIGASLIAEWDDVERKIQSARDEYGWEYEGQIVAPAHADPYIMATTIGQVLLARSGVANAGTRGDTLNEIYKANYPKATTVFRPDAKDVVDAVLQSGVPVFVVTNSQTAHVEAKIARLGITRAKELNIRGDARKFVIGPPDNETELFETIPETKRIPGLSRPIYLRRGKYLDALRRIWTETGTSPATTLVCGDIFELDLAMPAQLGCRVHLVTREGTADYEKRAVRGLAGGSVSEGLSGLLEVLELPG